MPMTNAERQAAWRARNDTPTSVMLPADAKQALRDYVKRQQAKGKTDVTMSDVVAKLIRTQLARKR